MALIHARVFSIVREACTPALSSTWIVMGRWGDGLDRPGWWRALDCHGTRGKGRMRRPMDHHQEPWPPMAIHGQEPHGCVWRPMELQGAPHRHPQGQAMDILCHAGDRSRSTRAGSYWPNQKKSRPRGPALESWVVSLDLHTMRLRVAETMRKWSGARVALF